MCRRILIATDEFEAASKAVTDGIATGEGPQGSCFRGHSQGSVGCLQPRPNGVVRGQESGHPMDKEHVCIGIS
jgi:hypothetical protein